jgi:hypothetical protein
MTTNYVASQGTVLYVLDDSVSPAAPTLLGQIKGITGIGGSRTVIDITNLGSVVKEKAAGLQDPGSGGFDLILDPTAAGHQLLETLSTQTTNATKHFYIGYSDGTGAPTLNAGTLKPPVTTTIYNRTGNNFDGFIKQYQRDFAVDSVVMVKCGVEITGLIVTSIKGGTAS